MSAAWVGELPMEVGRDGNPSRIAPCDGLPLDTSKEKLVNEDRRLQHFIDTLIHIHSLVLKQKDCYGSYLGVSGPQYVLIAEIAQSPCITVTELARKLDVSGSFIAVEANKLISSELIEKREHPLDGRSVVLDLSAKGRAALARLGPLRKALDEMMYRSLDGNHLQVLQAMMDRLVADARAALMNFERANRKADAFPRFRTRDATRLRMRSARLR